MAIRQCRTVITGPVDVKTIGSNVLLKIINLLLLLLLFRLLVPVFRWIAGGAGAPRPGSRKSSPANPQKKQSDYTDLTSYEIEDADYEDIRDK